MNPSTHSLEVGDEFVEACFARRMEAAEGSYIKTNQQDTSATSILFYLQCIMFDSYNHQFLTTFQKFFFCFFLVLKHLENLT